MLPKLHTIVVFKHPLQSSGNVTKYKPVTCDVENSAFDDRLDMTINMKITCTKRVSFCLNNNMFSVQ